METDNLVWLNYWWKGDVIANLNPTGYASSVLQVSVPLCDGFSSNDDDDDDDMRVDKALLCRRNHHKGV